MYTCSITINNTTTIYREAEQEETNNERKYCTDIYVCKVPQRCQRRSLPTLYLFRRSSLKEVVDKTGLTGERATRLSYKTSRLILPSFRILLPLVFQLKTQDFIF